MEQPAFDEVAMAYSKFEAFQQDEVELIDNLDGVRVAPETTDPLRAFLGQHLPDYLAYDQDQRRLLQDFTESELPFRAQLTVVMNAIDISKRLKFAGKSNAVDTIARIIFGIVGGLMLLVPLVVLTFIENNHYRLLAATFFTLAFVLVIAGFSNASNQELIAATAGYTAVLVVFVGSALSSGT